MHTHNHICIQMDTCLKATEILSQFIHLQLAHTLYMRSLSFKNPNKCGGHSLVVEQNMMKQEAHRFVFDDECRGTCLC